MADGKPMLERDMKPVEAALDLPGLVLLGHGR
jgi:hypothetical protein